MFKKYIILFIVLWPQFILSQVQQFTVAVTDTATLLSMPAVHSAAYGIYDGRWFIIGGRINGLHGFTPPNGFKPNGVNSTIYMVNPFNDTRKERHVLQNITDTTLLDALQAAFYQFAQNDSMLYITGGYGLLTDSTDNHTLSTLVAVNLKQLKSALENNTSIAPCFRVLEDALFKVCGGNMYRTDSLYHIVFGHDFNRSYSVNDTLGFFTQQYTNAIRSFVINDDGVNLSISSINIITDSINFHRRDYNLVPQIFPDGTLGQTAFSGVFQYYSRQPYLNCVNIKPTSYEVINNFNQNLSQYASGFMPVYNSADNKMSTVFFGGMSLYTYDASTNALLVDSLVPFVPTISKVVRHADSSLTEYVNPTEMPSLIGTNSFFIVDDTIPTFANGIINLNALPYGTTRVGSIIGGINSDLPHVSNTPNFSYASGFVMRVYLTKIIDTHTPETEVKNNILNLIAYPNPASKNITIQFETSKPEPVTIVILNQAGQQIDTYQLPKNEKGFYRFNYEPVKAGLYYSKVITSSYTKTVTFLVK